MKYKRLIVLVFALSVAIPQMIGAEENTEEGTSGLTKCKMEFNLKTWSAGYKSGKGEGVITCDNGETAKVKLRLKGGGLTAGKGEIREGRGTFSSVSGIHEVFGSYVAADASAGAGVSAAANVMTKGEVSLSLAGKGTGVELGFSVGKFTIKKKR